MLLWYQMLSSVRALQNLLQAFYFVLVLLSLHIIVRGGMGALQLLQKNKIPANTNCFFILNHPLWHRFLTPLYKMDYLPARKEGLLPRYSRLFTSINLVVCMPA